MRDSVKALEDDAVVRQLLQPPRLYSASEAIGRGGVAPRKAAIYAWYFDRIPPGVDASGCHRAHGCSLLYVGISPKRPPTNGAAPSRSHVHKRLRTHFAGNASGSTLRLTLGCLLEEEIGTVLRRVGSGERFTFTNPGEQQLDRWLQAHARVAWAEHPQPWLIEEELLERGLPLPLNIDGNPCLAFSAPLSAARSAARRRAEVMPVVADNGGPRRQS